MIGLTPAETLAARLIRDGDCLVWTGARDRYGYGWFEFQGKTLRTHRIAWELANGPIPGGLWVCHHCDNPPCCNTAHLFIGTRRDNVLDMSAKGRHGLQLRADKVRGSRNGAAVLSESKVLAIRAGLARGESLNRLAAQFGVGKTTIVRVRDRESWAWLD